jgi:secreted PhoX family phosphatase
VRAATAIVLTFVLSGPAALSRAGAAFETVPAVADARLHLPAGYSYRVMAYEGMPLSGGGHFGGRNDLNAFVPAPSQACSTSRCGWLLVSHETAPGGASVLLLARDDDGWQVQGGAAVDFGPVGGTWKNCGGTVTPWGTVLSSEEYPPAQGDLEDIAGRAGTSDDPLDYGWVVEIDPARARALRKLKAMGRFSHEGVAILPDGKTVLMADDHPEGLLFRFVADRWGDLQSGRLYALDAPAHRWIEIPRDASANARAAGRALGATPFDRLEDVEYNAVDGMVYLAETGGRADSTAGRYGRVLRFDPQTLELAVFVQGGADGLVNPDNLAIEPGSGRVLIQEDRAWRAMAPVPGMPNNGIWTADIHGGGEPRRFATVPLGAESTGAVFAPDGTLFFNIQHPAPPWRSSVIRVIAPPHSVP